MLPAGRLGSYSPPKSVSQIKDYCAKPMSTKTLLNYGELVPPWGGVSVTNPTMLPLTRGIDQC